MKRLIPLGRVLCLAGFLLQAEETPVPESLVIPSFKLEDQFQQSHHIQFPRSKPLVILVADRKGSAEIDSWVKRLKEQSAETFDLAGLADMSAVPKLLRPFVRGKFSQQRHYPVMIDWEGAISKSFRYEANRANLFLVDRTGRVAWHGFGNPSQDDLKRLLEIWHGLVRGKAERPSQPDR